MATITVMHESVSASDYYIDEIGTINSEGMRPVFNMVRDQAIRFVNQREALLVNDRFGVEMVENGQGLPEALVRREGKIEDRFFAKYS